MLLLSVPIIAYAKGDAGRESPFSLGAGARGMGMGRAFVSLSGDASAAFWNPAATAFIDRSEFSAFHTSLFMETNYDCLALSHPVGMLGVFSLSAGRLGTSEIPQWDIFNRRGDDFSAADMLLGISYGRTLPYGFATGTTVKGVGLQVGDDAGYGFGMDIGFQYKPIFIDGVIIGIGFNDLIQPRIKLRSAEDKYQTISRFGISYERRLQKNIAASAVAEIEKIGGRQTKFHPGLETAIYNSFLLRAGYDHDRMTFGGGLMYNFIRLDYAYENVDYLGGSHRISLGFSFGKSVSRARNAAVAEAIEVEKENWRKSLDSQRSTDFAINMSRGDSLFALARHQDALVSYQRALVLDESSQKARSMADSMMTIIIESASFYARDEKREELTSRRISAALEDMKAGRYNSAITQYELAYEIDPANKTIADLLEAARATRSSELVGIRRKARNYRDSGNHSSAIIEWNRLLSLEPGDTEALSGIENSRGLLRGNELVALAVRAMNEGRYSKAVEYMSEAQSLRPNDKSVQALLLEARAKSAPPTVLTDIKANSDHWAIYLQGLENYQAGDYKKAITNWESLRQFYPNNTDLENNVSQARQRLVTEPGDKQE